MSEVPLYRLHVLFCRVHLSCAEAAVSSKWPHSHVHTGRAIQPLEGHHGPARNLNSEANGNFLDSIPLRVYPESGYNRMGDDLGNHRFASKLRPGSTDRSPLPHLISIPDILNVKCVYIYMYVYIYIYIYMYIYFYIYI